MTEQCDDYDGYKKNKKPEYEYICGEVVWKSEDEMRDNLECYDNAHSRAKGITEKNKKQVEADLQKYVTAGRSEPLCKIIADLVAECVKREDSLYACNTEMIEFQECLNNTVHDIYENECEKRKSV